MILRQRDRPLSVEERLEEHRASAERHRRIVEEADARRADLARAQAAGDLSTEKAERELAELEERKRLHLAMAEHEDDVAAELEHLREQDERRQARARYEQAREDLARRWEAANAVVELLGKTLRTARGQAARLVEARAAVDEAQARMVELAHAADVDHEDYSEPVANADEPALPAELEQLVDVIGGGTRRPRSKFEADREAAERRAQPPDPEEVIRDAVRDVLFRGKKLSRIDGHFTEDGHHDGDGRPTGRWVGGIADELRPEARRRLRAARAEYQRLRALDDEKPPMQRRTIKPAELEPFVRGERQPAGELVEA